MQSAHPARQGGGPPVRVGPKETVGEAVVGFLVGFGDTVGEGVPFGTMDTSAQLKNSVGRMEDGTTRIEMSNMGDCRKLVPIGTRMGK